MAINNTAVSNPTVGQSNLPIPLTSGASAEGSSAQYLIAKALAETFSTAKKAEPDKEKQLLEYEEQAISNAVSNNGGGANNFQALKDFWLNLANSLPKGGDFQQFAQNQYNLFANNGKLSTLETQLEKDEATYQGSQKEDQNMQNAINWIENKISWFKKHWYVPGSWIALLDLYEALGATKGVKWCYDKAHAGDAQNVKVDQNAIKDEEGLIIAKSNSGNNLLSNNAGQYLQEADGVVKRNQTSIDQVTALNKEVGQLDNSLQV